VREFVRPSGDERTLDVGTGAGALALALAPLVREVVGLDPVPELLELARARALPNTEFVEGDGTALNYPDGAFDLAGTHRTLHHVGRPDRVVAELARVTRPGGHVLVSVMGLGGTVIHFASILVELARRDGAERQVEIARTGFLPEGEGYGHLAMRMYLWEELEALLSPHGEVVDGAAAGVLPHLDVEEPEIRALLEEFEERLAYDPGSRSCGEHIVGVLRVT
jgi:SAM-dependent methyltransferase